MRRLRVNFFIIKASIPSPFASTLLQKIKIEKDADDSVILDIL